MRPKKYSLQDISGYPTAHLHGYLREAHDADVLGAAALGGLGRSLGGELGEVVVLRGRARLARSNGLAASLLIIRSGGKRSATLGSGSAERDRRDGGEGAGEREHGHGDEEGEESRAGHLWIVWQVVQVFFL